MAIKDSAIEKWEYKKHTEVKHILLKKYVYAWTMALGKYNRKLIFFDGFAGRGEYYDNRGNTVALGSPLIAMQVADNLLELAKQRRRQPYFDKFICVSVEKDNDNYANLLKVYKREKENLINLDKIEFVPIKDEFNNVSESIIEKVGDKLAPTFFFIDPFGYKGVPFRIIKKILNLLKTEVFFTFMTRDINRFLELPNQENVLNELYLTTEWRDIKNIRDWRKRDRMLKDLYIKQLVKMAKVKYVFPFRVSMDERYMTLYYLIHVTNNFLGLRIMKDIMAKESQKKFAYLGPQDYYYMNQRTLFGSDLEALKKYLLQYFSGATFSFEEVLIKTYMYTNFVEGDYKKALKELEKEGKINMSRKGPRGGIKNNTTVEFKKQGALFLVSSKANSGVKTHYKEYSNLNGDRISLVERVNDGSIITRFDKTPIPQKSTDVVCPHFLELKWAYGCPFDCAWCYLKGTFRFRPEGIKPAFKDYGKIKKHVETFLSSVQTPEILNTGEIADSLMGEHLSPPFSKFIIEMFERQNIHKVLFVTKSSNIKNILGLPSAKQAIFSFSLNAIPVAERWEKRTPSPIKRIGAAKKLYDRGYTVRIRIDPMVPIEDWEKHYLKLIDLIFGNFIPERITLGSLRGLQSTINNTNDKSWAVYLKETSNWGKKIDFPTRYEMYLTILEYLKNKYNYTDVALCKETVKMWERIGMDWKKIKCNCIW